MHIEVHYLQYHTYNGVLRLEDGISTPVSLFVQVNRHQWYTPGKADDDRNDHTDQVIRDDRYRAGHRVTEYSPRQ